MRIRLVCMDVIGDGRVCPPCQGGMPLQPHPNPLPTPPTPPQRSIRRPMLSASILELRSQGQAGTEKPNLAIESLQAVSKLLFVVGWLGSTNGSPQRLQYLGASLRYDPSHPLDVLKLPLVPNPATRGGWNQEMPVRFLRFALRPLRGRLIQSCRFARQLTSSSNEFLA
jgi:hypothetical protein